MNEFSHKLLALALAIALPSLGCFSYYSIEDTDANSAIPRLAVLLAYPILLISLATAIADRFSKRPSKYRLWLAGICLMVSSGILLWARL
ncbi:MAG: hypothetical protein BVN35_07795 [Proteobacteria bacterium ST_bin11]|nr:MAG: hypothetical protein BVN35_07795 [Proteobacteria bacterium ST_bin11]